MYAVMTAESLGSDDLIPPPSPDLLRRYGTSELALRRLRSRHSQLLLMRTAPLADIAFVQRDTRVEALRLAAEHDGVVIDLAIPRAVEHHADDVSLAHATQWYVVDYDDLDAGRIRTLGLTSFGLPEVVVEGVDRRQHAMFSAVLAGLAHRLIAEWPAHDPVGAATVTLRDIAYGLGDAGATSTPAERSVEVVIDYDAQQGVLVVEVLTDPAVTLFAP
jgi:3',5'-cyclic AMP phosphodiesterase CpdA